MKGSKTLMLLLLGGFLVFVNPTPTFAKKQQTNSVSDYKVLRPPGNILLATVPVSEQVVVLNYNYLGDLIQIVPQGTLEYSLLNQKDCISIISAYSLRKINSLSNKRARDGLRCLYNEKSKKRAGIN